MVVIASAARTPLDSFQGALSPLEASHLGAAAVRGAVKRAGLGSDQVELALMGTVVTIAAMVELKLSEEKVNVHGGAASLGHPHRRFGIARGMASICIGGGEALALGLELAA